MDKRIAAGDIRRVAHRISEARDTLCTLLDFARDGGELYWVADTDIVHLFLNPRENTKYANIFQATANAPESTRHSEGLVALTAVLADFIFSDRFHSFHENEENSGHVFSQKVLLEPHTLELHEALVAKARAATEHASWATQALLGVDTLIKEIDNSLKAYQNDKTQDPQSFIKRVSEIIGRHLDFILPGGALEELLRAHELLKTRKTAIYEADCAWLHELLNQDTAVRAVDDLARRWLDDIQAEARRLDEQRKQSSRLGLHPPNTVTRPGDQELREQRDARVLAKLEYLGGHFIGEGKPKRRFVLISGHGMLRGLIHDRNHYWRKRGMPNRIFLLHPIVFLGNEYLFPLRDSPEHWVRITRALVLLEDSSHSRDDDFTEAEVPSASGADRFQPAEKIQTEWRDLLIFALPFLPAQSRNKRIKEISIQLLQKEPLKALEQSLYLALSEFFVVMAELGLCPRRVHGDGIPQRREPPPLRLAYFPKAESCIRTIIERGANPAQEPNHVSIRSLFVDVEREQESEGGDGFKYALLLCFATQFAVLGHWHAARVLASHAASVADVTSQKTPLVTGREAAFLECYCRCLEAKNVRELDLARGALDAYRTALSYEIEWWANKENRDSQAERCEKLGFKPQEEFPLLELRADSEKLLLDLTRLMHGWFVGNCTDSEIALSIEESSDEITGLLYELETLAERLGVNQEAATGMLDVILRFVRGQIQVCAVQCLILLFAGDPQRRESLRANTLLTPAAMKTIDINPTAVTCLIATVACCIWGTPDEQVDSLKKLESMDGRTDITPYDPGRRDFFKRVATMAAQ